MSIHRLLANEDVLHILFDQFRLQPPVSFDILYTPNELQDSPRMLKRTLVNAACTCSSFADPASRVLWSVMDGLSPLLRLLPSFKQSTHSTVPPHQGIGGTQNDSDYVLDGDVSEADWTRFEHVAGRVRCLLYDPYVSLDRTVVDALVARYGRNRGLGSLLPNLQFLVWPESNDDDRQRILGLLCSDALQYVVIPDYQSGDYQYPGQKDLLTIADHAPNVRHFRADLSNIPLGVDSPLLRFAALRSLKFPLGSTMDEVIFTYVSKLPYLAVLDLSGVVLPNPTAAYAEHPVMKRNTFPSLRKLLIPGEGYRPALHLDTLSRISSTSMEALWLTVHVALKSELIQFVATLCSLDAMQSLRYLYLSVDAPYMEYEGLEMSSIVFADIAQPLLKLRFVEDFSLSSTFPYAIDVTDEDVGQLSSGWPRLTRISLRATDRPPATRPSLGALIVFAERCPHLKDLGIEAANITEADVTKLEARVATASYRPCAALEEFALDRADGSNPIDLDLLDDHEFDRLARVMHRVFPSLREEDAFGWGIRIYQEPHPFAYTDESEYRPAARGLFRLLEKLLALKAQSSEA
ncbi:hypothetical protein C8Q80DRAFT_1147321 [Daedaleopsis nitida]|nr:hypothetical protein C8Q80DRAFT_1147321 [Daedaleopsis nitida]